MGLAKGAEGLVVAADDVLDGVLRAVFGCGKLGAALIFAVGADNFEFGGDVEFALVGGFDAVWGALTFVMDGAGLAFGGDINGGCGHSLSSVGGGWWWRSGVMC